MAKIKVKNITTNKIIYGREKIFSGWVRELEDTKELRSLIERKVFEEVKDDKENK